MATFNSEKMAEVRKAKQLTIRQMGALIGKSHVTVLKYENRTLEPNLGVIEKIAQALELTLQDLVVEERKMTMNERYQLTLKKEVLKEIASGISGAIVRYTIKNSIAESTNPFVILSEQIATIQNNEILMAKDMSELSQLEGQLTGLKNYFEALVNAQGKVA
ncbi:helix-turn-helix domain-containing protein [Lactococcus lactis]|uniref:helix-turn-helix domain-containing protein n=1 Tax=Lactococcus lactis TaxID=1358 RepID=UPI0018C507AF|nr:helix-turn-helix domain-containing protein [Lactococcus lactis]MBG1278051.1 helix-turn-helix transcriptional regulator [Lactococcus lactis subsp. lactis]